jgi:general secretion pathway protein A
MFLEHYGLNEQPFGVTPDPRFLYLGPKHRQALKALNYGTELSRGFLTLIAKPGMGKTSLLFQYLGGLRNNARTAFLYQIIGDPRDLMRYLLADLGLDSTGKDLPEMHSILNQVLMEEMRAGRRFVLVIDEAQNLDEKALEFVRLLSNFETPWMKLMQIVLAGQPQLAEQLAQPSMAQLRQRISFSIRIEPLTRKEIDAYVDHRLWVAGYNGLSLFTVGARMLLAEHSEGIPRNISNLCFYAMSLGWATKVKPIDREIMRDVIADMAPGSPIEKPNEETDVSSKAAEEPKQQVIRIGPHPAVLTAPEPPAHTRLTKVFLASALLLSLGWAGFHFNFEQRIGDSWHDIAASVRNYIVPASSPGPLGPADSRNPDVPLQGRTDILRPSRDSN